MVLQSALVPPRTRLPADERADIIDAAYACLSSPHQGPVSVAAILDAAGLSTRAFYRQFASKDDLFLAMLRRDSEAVLRRLRRVAQHDGGTEAQLRAWIDCLLGLAYHPRMRAHVVVLDSDEVRVAKGYREASAELRAGRLLNHPVRPPQPRPCWACASSSSPSWRPPPTGPDRGPALCCGHVASCKLDWTSGWKSRPGRHRSAG